MASFLNGLPPKTETGEKEDKPQIDFRRTQSSRKFSPSHPNDNSLVAQAAAATIINKESTPPRPLRMPPPSSTPAPYPAPTSENASSVRMRSQSFSVARTNSVPTPPKTEGRPLVIKAVKPEASTTTSPNIQKEPSETTKATHPDLKKFVALTELVKEKYDTPENVDEVLTTLAREALSLRSTEDEAENKHYPGKNAFPDIQNKRSSIGLDPSELDDFKFSKEEKKPISKIHKQIFQFITSRILDLTKGMVIPVRATYAKKSNQADILLKWINEKEVSDAATTNLCLYRTALNQFVELLELVQGAMESSKTIPTEQMINAMIQKRNLTKEIVTNFYEFHECLTRCFGDEDGKDDPIGKYKLFIERYPQVIREFKGLVGDIEARINHMLKDGKCITADFPLTAKRLKNKEKLEFGVFFLNERERDNFHEKDKKSMDILHKTSGLGFIGRLLVKQDKKNNDMGIKDKNEKKLLENWKKMGILNEEKLIKEDKKKMDILGKEGSLGSIGRHITSENMTQAGKVEEMVYTLSDKALEICENGRNLLSYDLEKLKKEEELEKLKKENAFKNIFTNIVDILATHLQLKKDDAGAGVQALKNIFIIGNPIDEKFDIRELFKCLGFAHNFGLTVLEVTNLNRALISESPNLMKELSTVNKHGRLGKITEYLKNLLKETVRAELPQENLFNFLNIFCQAVFSINKDKPNPIEVACEHFELMCKILYQIESDPTNNRRNELLKLLVVLKLINQSSAYTNVPKRFNGILERITGEALFCSLQNHPKIKSNKHFKISFEGKKIIFNGIGYYDFKAVRGENKGRVKESFQLSVDITKILDPTAWKETYDVEVILEEAPTGEMREHLNIFEILLSRIDAPYKVTRNYTEKPLRK